MLHSSVIRGTANTRPSSGFVMRSQFNTGITVTGAGVSKWADQSGNGNDLLQGTDTNRPSKEADGSILFDGVDNNLRSTFTLNQPYTVYLLGKQITWASKHIFNGVTANTALFQTGATPSVSLFAGAVVAANTDWTLGTYNGLSIVFDGSSSLIQVADNAATTGDPGAADPGGFTLAASNSTPASFSNIQVKEVLIYNVAHDANQRFQDIRYLTRINQI